MFQYRLYITLTPSRQPSVAGRAEVLAKVKLLRALADTLHGKLEEGEPLYVIPCVVMEFEDAHSMYAAKAKLDKLSYVVSTTPDRTRIDASPPRPRVFLKPS